MVGKRVAPSRVPLSSSLLLACLLSRTPSSPKTGPAPPHVRSSLLQSFEREALLDSNYFFCRQASKRCSCLDPIA